MRSKRWFEIEKECYKHDNPPDEIFRILEELWTILLVFKANFHQAKDGVLYRLRPLGPLEHLYNLVHMRNLSLEEKERFWRKRALDSPIRVGVQKHLKTLGDIEDALRRTTARLDRELEALIPQSHRFQQHQKRRLLRAVDTGRDHASLVCMLRMCTLTTPTRSDTASRMIIADGYARMMSQLVLSYPTPPLPDQF